MSLSNELKSHVMDFIKRPIPQNANMPIVSRSIPIPFFGDIEKARFATIAINPSNLEFETRGVLLSGDNKRFVDRDTLNVADTDELNDEQAACVYTSLTEYFYNNPYRGWFDRLEERAGKMFNASYYDGTMVNLDIYPWATQDKWSCLPAKEKARALQGYGLLKTILTAAEPAFDFIYVNGKGVKEQLEKYFGITLAETPIETKSKSNYVRCMYSHTLTNGTRIIGSSCYIQNSYETNDYLTELHDILSREI